VTNVVFFKKGSEMDSVELEDLLMEGQVLPSAEVYMVSTLGCSWFNIGKRNDVLREARARWGDLKIWVETDKLRWGSRNFHFHVTGPAVHVLLFTEMIGKYV
jgi:hypothetical protein